MTILCIIWYVVLKLHFCTDTDLIIIYEIYRMNELCLESNVYIKKKNNYV